MTKLEINPTRAIDGSKVEHFKRNNAPLYASKILEAHEQHSIETAQASQANTNTAARLNSEVMEAQTNLNHAERAIADAKSFAPHDREYVDSIRATLEAAKERRDKHQKKMERKRQARNAASPMPVEDMHKGIVRAFHRPTKPVEFKPVKDGEATTESLLGLFAKMGEHRKAIAEAQAAFLPTDEAFDDFSRDVDRGLKRYHTNALAEYFNVRYLDEDPRKPQQPQVSLDINALAMRAVREMILSFGLNVFRDLGEKRAFEGEPLSRAERAKVVAEHLAAIDKLELEEGRLRRALAMKSIFVPLRSDTVNLFHVLGVTYDAEEAARRKRSAVKAADAA